MPRRGHNYYQLVMRACRMEVAPELYLGLLKRNICDRLVGTAPLTFSLVALLLTFRPLQRICEKLAIKNLTRPRKVFSPKKGRVDPDALQVKWCLVWHTKIASTFVFVSLLLWTPSFCEQSSSSGSLAVQSFYAHAMLI